MKVRSSVKKMCDNCEVIHQRNAVVIGFSMKHKGQG